MKNISKLEINSVLSESAHYKVIDFTNGLVKLFHLESEQEVTINREYIKNCIDSGDEYDVEVKVGKEDKFWTQKQIDDTVLTSKYAPGDLKVGDLKQKGIRTIWEDIHTSQVFTVCFKKADKVKSQKALKAELEQQREYSIGLIEKAKKDKKSMAEAYKVALKYIQNNPISEIEEGEERILRGYKIQFSSRDGKYNCVDMDLPDGDNIRPVNILTLQWIIINNVKYIVE